MPYILDGEKHEMSDAIHDLSMFIQSKGDLNYAICELIGQLILNEDRLSYTKISEWIDTLPDAEAELRRRILNKYEDIKIIQNGDVPSFIKIFDLLQQERTK